MTVLVYLIPVSLVFGVGSLAAFLWALQSGQYEDLEGAGERILIDSEPDRNARTTELATKNGQLPLT